VSSMEVNLRTMFARFLGYRNSRNLWKAFGYPASITSTMYHDAYLRGGIHNRIVKAYPAACWRDGAEVMDDDGAGLDPSKDNYSAFAHTFYRLEKDFKVFHYLARADRLSRLGHYSVLVMGFGDNKSLSEEMVGQAPLKYLNAYAEHAVTVSKWDTDTQSERFGFPVIYKVTPNKDKGVTLDQSLPIQSFDVHHSRVLHVNENQEDNEIFGEPCLRPVWNYLLDLEKVAGSSAETFWLNARGGMAIEASADAKLSTESIAALKVQAEEYENQLRRVMAMQGATVKMLATNVASPKDNLEMLFSLISGTTGIPQRVIFGSERGELASSEDANSWESRVDERRKGHCGPFILEPFLQRMIDTGNLPEPKGDWWVEWPEASSASPEKEADIAVKRAQALAAYANSASDQIVGSTEFRIWLGLPAVPEDGVIEEEDDPDDLGAGLPPLEVEEEDDAGGEDE